MAGGDNENTDKPEQQEKMADGEQKPAEEEQVKEESSDEEPAPGLLDKPVMIFDQKRERKRVERLSIDTMLDKPKKEALDYTKGRGVRLGDLDIVQYELDQSVSVELKPLHKLLYGRDGKVSVIKRNIRAFCGFPFEIDTKEYGSLQWSLEKFTNTGLQRMCEIFGLDQKGKRDELKEKVLKFLMEPYKTNKKVPGSAKAKKKKKKTKSSDKASSPNEKLEEAASDGEEDEKEEDQADDDDDNKEEDEEKPAEKKKTATKTKKPKATVIKLPKPQKKRNKSEEKVKKTPSKKSAKKSTKGKSDEEDNDDQPLAKKARPEGPSDAMIEKIVRELLADADLETMTMKMICKQVFDKFPGQDLSERKSFIKDTVKQVIS
eukprot:gene4773-5400_t